MVLTQRDLADLLSISPSTSPPDLIHFDGLLLQMQPGITELSPKRDLIRARRPSQLASEATSCGSDTTHTTTVSATLQYELHHIHQSGSDMGMQWLIPRSRQPSSPLGVQQSGLSGRVNSRHRLSTASTQRTMSMTVIPVAIQVSVIVMNNFKNASEEN